MFDVSPDGSKKCLFFWSSGRPRFGGVEWGSAAVVPGMLGNGTSAGDAQVQVKIPSPPPPAWIPSCLRSVFPLFGKKRIAREKNGKARINPIAWESKSVAGFDLYKTVSERVWI